MAEEIPPYYPAVTLHLRHSSDFGGQILKEVGAKKKKKVFSMPECSSCCKFITFDEILPSEHKRKQTCGRRPSRNHLKLHLLPRRSIYRKLIMKAHKIYKLYSNIK